MLDRGGHPEGGSTLRFPINQAADLAASLERGQATTTLCDHFEVLSESLNTAPFTMTLLGLDAASRAAALGWLCGVDFPVLSVQVPGAVGLVEVQLAERGYTLIKSGRRQEFDRLEPFLEAVHATDLVRQGDADAWLEPMHPEVAAPRGLQGLRLLIPESPAAIAEGPALLARLRSESNLLVIAGPADHELDEAVTAAIRHLAADGVATLAITCGPSPPDASFRGWTEHLDGTRLPAVHLDPEAAPPPVPDFLLDRQSDIRQGLFACQQARRFESALDMLEERIQQDLRQHEARRKMLMRRSTALNDPNRDRALQEASGAIRRALEETKARIEAELIERHRERLLPTSTPNNKINNLLEDFTTDDLAKESLGRIVQLGVAPRVRREVRRLIGDIVRADLRADIERLNCEIDTMTGEAASKLEAAGGGPLDIRPEPLEESMAWKPIQESLQLDSRYRGELPQKGLRERLFEFVMHCRTPVFLMTIVVSPLYSFAPNLREPLLKFSPILFLGGAFWAYRGLKEEEHKTAERELIRLRDTLRPEVRHLYKQALDDWSKRAGQHLDRVANRLRQQVDEHLKARVSEIGRDSARERVEVQDKRNAVDNRLRDLGGLMQQVGRLRQATAEARQALERSARDAVRNIQGTVKVS
jgi:hypothetical protein